MRLLDSFEGVLHTDGYTGYNQVCRKQPISWIGCWELARRQFVKASKAKSAKKKGQKVSKADVAIGKICKLYAIEKKVELLDPEEKTEQRQNLAQPILAGMKAWLETNSRRAPKDCLTWIAINYTLDQLDLLVGHYRNRCLNICNALKMRSAHSRFIAATGFTQILHRTQKSVQPFTVSLKWPKLVPWNPMIIWIRY